VGFDKIRKQLAELHELRIVLLDGLCIRRPVDEVTRKSWSEYGISQKRSPLSDIRDVCPKIAELDLSRNLFGDWAEIVSICEQLDNLKSLRVDGNRIQNVGFTDHERLYFHSVFKGIKHLTLENTLLEWKEIVNIVSLFRDDQSLVLSNNNYTTLDSTVSLSILPSSITTIDLESNTIGTIADLSPLANLPNLTTLILKKNPITAITKSPSEPFPTFRNTLTTVDLSHCEVDNWSFIDSLHSVFPALTSLRISHNPLFAHLTGPDHRILSTDDGYMLTIARLANLRSLNYSAISAKDRLNAESYYLSLITVELSVAPEMESEAIKGRHRRWTELCEEYGEPEIRRSTNRVNPNSLAARLVKLNFHLGDSTVQKLKNSAQALQNFETEIPKSFSVYSVLGIVGKHFGLPPMKLNLIYETAEWDVVDKGANSAEDGLWDSEEESGDEGGGSSVDWGGRRVRREIEILAGTRGIGSWVDGPEADIRVEMLLPS
jgi:Leucine-rich repeat (LRR) protein